MAPAAPVAAVRLRRPNPSSEATLKCSRRVKRAVSGMKTQSSWGESCVLFSLNNSDNALEAPGKMSSAGRRRSNSAKRALSPVSSVSRKSPVVRSTQASP